MQVTPNIISNSLLQTIQNQENQITQLQQQESTGQVFTLPSDNPTAAETSLSLTTTLNQIQGYTASAQSAQGWMNDTNGSLSSMISLWNQALQTATQASNSTNNAQDLQAMAETVKGLQQNLGQLLNTQYEGSYIFGGFSDQTPPLAPLSTGGYPTHISPSTWPTGDKGYTVNAGVHVTVNLTGWEPVGQSTSTNYLATAYNDLGNLAKAIQGGPSAVQALLPQLQQDQNNLVSAQSLEGGRLARVKNTLSQLQNASTDISQSLQNVSGANMAQVTTQLAQEEDSYQAALQSGSKILSLSLLNYINP